MFIRVETVSKRYFYKSITSLLQVNQFKLLFAYITRIIKIFKTSCSRLKISKILVKYGWSSDYKYQFLLSILLLSWKDFQETEANFEDRGICVFNIRLNFPFLKREKPKT